MSGSIQAIAESARQHRLLVFAGAGVSVLAPSHAPGWWDIYAAAARALLKQLEDAFPELAVLVPRDLMLSTLMTQQLANIVIDGFATDRFTDVLKVVDIADINENHRAIASLAKEGYLRAVVTTNFDTLLERAAALRQTSMEVVTPNSASYSASHGCHLLKLHGSAVDPVGMIEATWQKAREINSTLVSAWNHSIAGSDLLVLGYSGADLNFGAARAFFSDFVSKGNRIWWLYRPKSFPQLPEHVRLRCEFIEGSLPDFLREVRSELEIGDFKSPVTGRDAAATLEGVMDAWSKGPDIGAWDAATFFLMLADRESTDEAYVLATALIQLGMETAAKFQPGAAVVLNEPGVANFLGYASKSALDRGQFEEARTMCAASLNYIGGIEELRHDEASPEEQQMSDHDLALKWSEYALIFLLEGEADRALGAYHRAMERSLRAGEIGIFLFSLRNILNIGIGIHAVRRCMQISEAALLLADRTGDVQQSVGFRVLLGTFALERHESWLAEHWLKEACGVINASQDFEYDAIVQMQLGMCVLRRGEIAEGLMRIAENAMPSVNCLEPAVHEISKYLNTLNIPQSTVLQIELLPADVPRIAEEIEATIERARAQGETPWQGQHCRMYSSASSGITGEDAARYQIGVCEFDRDTARAVEIALELAGILHDARRYYDASWAARNITLRAGIDAPTRARAHSIVASSFAHIGRLADARIQFEAARNAFAEAREQPSVFLIEAALWFSIQCGSVKEACEWATTLLAIHAENDADLPPLAEALANVETWGAEMEPVASVLRGAPPADETVLQTASTRPTMKFRRFRGTGALDDRSAPEADDILQEAQKCLVTGDFNRALEILDRLSTFSPLSEAQGGMACGVQILAASRGRSVVEIDKHAQLFRGNFLNGLHFTALTCAERGVAYALLREHGAAEFARHLRLRGWVGALASDSIAATGLLALYAHWPTMAAEEVPLSASDSEALLRACFLGIDEPFHTALLAAKQPEEDAPSVAEEILMAYESALVEATDAPLADRAMWTAITQLRKARTLFVDRWVRILDARALVALYAGRFEEAARAYARLRKSFRSRGNTRGVLHSLAGEARATSRAGNHAAAIDLLKDAIEDAPANGSDRSNLLLALASVHMRQAATADEQERSRLLAHASVIYRDALACTAPASRARAEARLALAYCLAQLGEQTFALEEIDLAISELAHLGNPAAFELIAWRQEFAVGDWARLRIDLPSPTASDGVTFISI